jgi:hypothetical protein
MPGKDSDTWRPRPYDIVWVRANTIRRDDGDWHYYTLGNSGTLLSKPKPLAEVFLHGQRPYVFGFVVVETHKTYPTSKVELVNDLQRAANDDWNLRFDNIKMNLQPRQFVKAGSGMDTADLMSFRPGKVVIVPAKGPINDVVQWDRPPDMTQASYAEQDRINLDFDEMTGEFTNSSVQSSQVQQQSATGMNLMSGQASGMNEYELRVFVESFVDPLIRLLVKLEQAYETDPVVLAIAGRNAQLVEKFGIDAITDDLLQQELTTRVNVGIGATNPVLKLHHLQMGAQMLGQMFGPALPMGLNFEEVTKEVMGLCGYKDGGRFFKPGFDPAPIMQAMHQKQPPAGAQGNPAADQAKLQAAQIESETRLKVAQIDAQSDAMSEDAETQRAKMNAMREFITAHLDRQQKHAAAMVPKTPAPHPALGGLMGG